MGKQHNSVVKDVQMASSVDKLVRLRLESEVKEVTRKSMQQLLSYKPRNMNVVVYEAAHGWFGDTVADWNLFDWMNFAQLYNAVSNFNTDSFHAAFQSAFGSYFKHAEVLSAGEEVKEKPFQIVINGEIKRPRGIDPTPEEAEELENFD